MLAYEQLLPGLISSQPVHVQHDPAGESRDTVSSAAQRERAGSKLLPLRQTNQSFDAHRDRLSDYRNPLEERLFQEVRGFAGGGRDVADRCAFIATDRPFVVSDRRA
jgi:hypothetical protein